MSQPPPGSTRTDTLFPYTTLFRSRGGWLQRPGRIAILFQVRAVVEGDPDQRPGGMAAPLQLARRMLRMSEIHDIGRLRPRSEEHTSELQSLMRISYAVFCLKTKKNTSNNTILPHTT